MVIKARGLKGRKTKARARGKSPLLRPRMGKLQSRQRKQRLRPKKSILRPRTLLLSSQARRKILLLFLLKSST